MRKAGDIRVLLSVLGVFLALLIWLLFYSTEERNTVTSEPKDGTPRAVDAQVVQEPNPSNVSKRDIASTPSDSNDRSAVQADKREILPIEKWKTYDELVADGDIEPAYEILFLTIDYENTGSSERLNVSDAVIKNGYVPFSTQEPGGYSLEILNSAGDAVALSPIQVDNEPTIPPLAKNQIAKPVSLDSVRRNKMQLSVITKWSDEFTSTRVRDKSGKIHSEYSLSAIKRENNKPNFRSMRGDQVYKSSKGASRSRGSSIEKMFSFFQSEAKADASNLTLDIVIMQDKFTNLAQFRTIAESMISVINNMSPFQLHTASIRYVVVENTNSLGCYYHSTITRLLLCDNATVRSTATSYGAVFDKIAVVVSSSTYGGSANGVGGDIATTYSGSQRNSVFVHEIGHTLKLYDEYQSYTGQGSILGVSNNCFSGTPPAQAWSGLTNVYSNPCSYANWYASSAESIMRFIDVDYFNNVSASVIINEINRYKNPQPPLISTHPSSQNKLIGQSVSFSVVASGYPTLLYQWFKNGAVVPGATSSTYTINSLTLDHVGDYTVRITNGQGQVTSNVAMLRLPPVITQQPSDVIVPLGGTATFSVTVTSYTSPVYQWFKNDLAISGANSSTYIISNVQSDSAGAYRVSVANVAGQVSSASANLTIGSAPVFTTHPQSQNKTVGSSVSFSTTHTGSTPITYQWLKNGTAISGATSATYSISNVQASHAGNYALRATNTHGTATSQAATLNVGAAPSITAQPQSLARAIGSSATFSVTASGSGTLTYQWKRGTANITGAMSSSYTIASVQALHAGDYTVVITNPFGNITSQTATLSVGNLPTITTQPLGQLKRVGESFTLSVVATGDGTLTYQWMKDGANISGATSANYSVTNAQKSHSGSYSVRVTNAYGNVTSNSVQVTVDTAPIITAQPQEGSINTSTPLTLSVRASGLAPISYQWLKNNQAIAGATGANLNLSGADSVGRYKVQLQNQLGSATSNEVQVYWSEFLPPESKGGDILPVTSSDFTIQGGIDVSP